ncbi:MAG TPA: hypothetical protein VIH71_10815 [Solirubrobacteraceae bacterium]
MTSPPLAELIGIVGGGGLVLGGLGGLALSADTNRRLAENVALGTALGAFVGTAVAFLIYLAVIVAGWLA